MSIWLGLLWCENCKQNVDVYADDNKENAECGFCGKILGKVVLEVNTEGFEII